MCFMLQCVVQSHRQQWTKYRSDYNSHCNTVLHSLSQQRIRLLLELI